MKNLNKKISESVNKSLGKLLREEGENSQGIEKEMQLITDIEEQVMYDLENFNNSVKWNMNNAKRLLTSVYQNFVEDFKDVITRQINSGYDSGEAYYIFETNVDGSNEAWEADESPALDLEQRTYDFYDDKTMPGTRVDMDTLSNGNVKLTLMIKLFNSDRMSSLVVNFLNNSDDRIDLYKRNDDDDY